MADKKFNNWSWPHHIWKHEKWSKEEANAIMITMMHGLIIQRWWIPISNEKTQIFAALKKEIKTVNIITYVIPMITGKYFGSMIYTHWVSSDITTIIIHCHWFGGLYYLLTYCKVSHRRHATSPNLNVFNLVLQLSLSNPMKPGVESRLKM